MVSPAFQSIRGGPSIRGGIGEFRNFLRSDLLSDAIGTTGLPGTTQRLVCTGPAAPIPDWQAYMNDPSSVPTTCAGGSSVFADTARSAILVDPSYKPMHSWRGTLGWTNTLLGNYFAIDGTYSLNLNQPGVVDLNFAGTPQFTLAGENNRPVFVPPSSIVASTGAATAVRIAPLRGVRPSDRSRVGSARRYATDHGVRRSESSVPLRLRVARLHLHRRADAAARLRPEHGDRSARDRVGVGRFAAAASVHRAGRAHHVPPSVVDDVGEGVVGAAVYADRRGRREWRRMGRRSRVHLRSRARARRRRVDAACRIFSRTARIRRGRACSRN